jgi:para-aminobenzoate synthetase component 1
VTVTDLRGDRPETSETIGAQTEILEKLRFWLKKFSASAHPEIPFTGGAVGYFSYELGVAWERVAVRPEYVSSHNDAAVEPLLAEFSFYDGVLAYAHETSHWFCIGNNGAGRNVKTIVQSLTHEVSHVLTCSPAQSQGARTKSENVETISNAPEVNSRSGWVESKEDRQAYIKAIERIKAYIAAGDIYQVNLAQEFSGKWHGSAAALYQRLRERTPAPFGAFAEQFPGKFLATARGCLGNTTDQGHAGARARRGRKTNCGVGRKSEGAG